MRWFPILLIALIAGLPTLSKADPVSSVFADYQTLLERHLMERDLEHDGLVSAFDYQAALEDDNSMEQLRKQRETLKNFDPATLDDRATANAFWLNAYNFFMIAHILEEKPDGELVASVWDYGGRLNPLRRNVFERALFEIGGNKYSLDGMEKDTLLGDDFRERGWADARVHFAVNCASVGCPPLRRQIYTADNVDALLAENTRRALNTDRHLKVDGRTLYLTRLFDWYEDHFKWDADSVRDWIKAHADERVREKIADTERIRYISYDWKLNKPENFSEFD